MSRMLLPGVRLRVEVCPEWKQHLQGVRACLHLWHSHSRLSHSRIRLWCSRLHVSPSISFRHCPLDSGDFESVSG
eukprot:1678369-Rhodomonas_salina.1